MQVQCHPSRQAYRIHMLQLCHCVIPLFLGRHKACRTYAQVCWATRDGGLGAAKRGHGKVSRGGSGGGADLDLSEMIGGERGQAT